MRLRTATAATAALVTLAGPAALAHDTWLLPTRSTVPPGVEATFDLTSGPAFPANGTAIGPERVAAARLRLAGAAEALPAPTATRRSLRFRVPLRRPGVATVWVSLAARDLELDSADVMEYLAEAGAPDAVRQAYLAQGAERQWRERSARHAKAFVRVTSPLRPAPVADTSWAAPVGAALELVPERDPTRLRAGDTLTVRLLRGGRPVFALPVGLVPGGPGPGRAVLRRTGPFGRASFVLPRAGRWLLRAADFRRAPGAGTGWESDVATLAVVAR